MKNKYLNDEANTHIALPARVREQLHEKYRDSIKMLTNKIGGMGKDCKMVHKEQKPSSKHSF